MRIALLGPNGCGKSTLMNLIQIIPNLLMEKLNIMSLQILLISINKEKN